MRVSVMLRVPGGSVAGQCAGDAKQRWRACGRDRGRKAAVRQGRRDRLGDPARLLLAGCLVDQLQDAAGTQQVLDELQFGVGWPDPKQVEVDREDLVEALAGERSPDQVEIGQIEMVE